MTQPIRLVTYALVLLAVLLLAWVGAPKHNFVPRGLLLPASATTYPAIASSAVSVTNGAAASGTLVGSVNAESYAPSADNDSVIALEKYAVQLAAQHGANQLAVYGVYRNPSDKSLHLVAKALRH